MDYLSWTKQTKRDLPNDATLDPLTLIDSQPWGTGDVRASKSMLRFLGAGFGEGVRSLGVASLFADRLLPRAVSEADFVVEGRGVGDRRGDGEARRDGEGDAPRETEGDGVREDTELFLEAEREVPDLDLLRDLETVLDFLSFERVRDLETALVFFSFRSSKPSAPRSSRRPLANDPSSRCGTLTALSPPLTINLFTRRDSSLAASRILSHARRVSLRSWSLHRRNLKDRSRAAWWDFGQISRRAAFSLSVRSPDRVSLAEEVEGDLVDVDGMMKKKSEEESADVQPDQAENNRVLLAPAPGLGFIAGQVVH